MLRKILYAFGFIAIVLAILTRLPFNYWLVRIVDFPHLQLTILTAIAIVTFFIRFDFKKFKDYAFITVLVSCFIFQFSLIYPYTKFSSFDINPSSKLNNDSIKVYTANVKQKNEHYSKLEKSINEVNPDIILLTEINKNWLKNIKKIVSEKYPYKVEQPLENTYGMAFYSKFQIYDTHVKYLITDTIPSIHTKVILNSKDTVQIFGIHPTPPVLGQNISSADRDSEMMQVSLLSKESKYPVIVLGDFNDVAWSETTVLFEKVSGLLDVRKGRGIYNTYSADNFITKWPLDHIFVSPEFRLKNINKGQNIGSDHYPFMVSLTYEPKIMKEQIPEKPTKEELQRAQDQIDKQ